MNNLDYDSNTGTNLKTSGKNITSKITICPSYNLGAFSYCNCPNIFSWSAIWIN